MKVLAIVVVVVTLTLPSIRLGQAIFGDSVRATLTRHTFVGRPLVQDSLGQVLTATEVTAVDVLRLDRKRERTTLADGEREPKHRLAADERSQRATVAGSVRSNDDHRGLTSRMSAVRDEPVKNDTHPLDHNRLQTVNGTTIVRNSDSNADAGINRTDDG